MFEKTLVGGDGQQDRPQQTVSNGYASGIDGDRDDPYIVFGYGSLISRVRFLSSITACVCSGLLC